MNRALIACLCLSLGAASTAGAQTAPAPPAGPTPAEHAAAAAALLAENTRRFDLSAEGLTGAGADFLRERTARSQFVLLGEAHLDHDTPVFALGLYRLLQSSHGFDRLVVENDPLAMEAVDAAAGDLDQVAALARRYPTHIGFASDQDLRLYAAAAEGSRPGAPAVWGIEQAQGGDRYLEELADLAPAAVRARVTELRDEARARGGRDQMSLFLHDDATLVPRLEALRADWAPADGSRAAVLLDGLIRSAVIYSYNRRANAGEPVGLYNNTEREQLFREQFIARYRADSAGGRTPRALFKMGGWHMYRGKSPGQAYTIANLAHELAFLNGMDAYAINIVPVGGYATDLSVFPAWMRPLLPAVLPEGPVVIDLRPLKPRAGLFANQAPEGDRWQTRDFIQSFDALVILPNSAKATWDLTGFPVP